MFHGRRRRYFGYPKRADHFIDTPDSALSYASIISADKPVPKTLINSGKCFVQDKPLPSKYIERYLHNAVAKQIPSLLPALKNTTRFRGFEGNPMKIHSPKFEHQRERSLYYLWLAKDDRDQLCTIHDCHLGTREAGHFKGITMKKAPVADYSNIPRTLSVLDTGYAIKPLDGLGKSTKITKAEFLRQHGKSPAMEAICHMYPQDERSELTDKDVRDCINAAKLILGPYAGVNTTFTTPEDIPVEILDKIKEEQDKVEQEKVVKEKEAATATDKRTFGYHSSQPKYERKILAGMEYYNQLKSGVVGAVPPKELFEKEKGEKMKKAKSTMAGSMTGHRSQATSSMFQASMSSKATIAPSMTETDTSSRRSTHAASHRGQVPPHKRKFNKEKVTEEDYMDFYVHFVGDDEEVHTENRVGSITDISKLRRKMHLDPNSDDERDEAIIENFIRNDSFSDMLDPIERRILKQTLEKHRKSSLSAQDRQIVRKILLQQAGKVASPKIREEMLQLSAAMGRKSMTRSVDAGSDSSELSLVETESERIFEDELGYVDLDVVKFLERGGKTKEDSVSNHSSDTELSSGHVSWEGLGCSLLDLDCYSGHKALGRAPFAPSRNQATTCQFKPPEPKDKETVVLKLRRNK